MWSKKSSDKMNKETAYFQKQFYLEAREIVEKVCDDILQAEAEPENQELLNAIFRGIHTIKGSAGSFDLDDVSEFAHHLEGVLSVLRDGKISLTPGLVDVVLAGSDHIGKMIEDHAAGQSPTIDTDLVQQFAAFCEQRDADDSPISDICVKPDDAHDISMSLPPKVTEAFQEATAIGLYVFRVRLKYTSELLENGYDPLVFLKKLKRSCTFYLAIPEETSDAPLIPDIGEFHALTLYLCPSIYVATALSADDIRDLTFDPDLIMVDPVQVSLDEMDAGPLHEFADSAADMLESLEKAVIDYETSGSRESLNEIFRVVHNFKGDADLVGLEDITAFAHTLESLLERLRSGTIRRTFALVDVILQSVDFLRQSVQQLGQGVKIPELPPVFETLKYYAAAKDDLDRKNHLLRDVSPELREVFEEQARQYRDILLRYALQGDEATPDQKTREIVQRALKGLANASEFVGLTSLRSAAEKINTALDQKHATAFSEGVEKITAFIGALGGEPESEPAHRILPADEGMTRRKPGPESRTMRIDERKVDHFTNMIGELLIARNTYAHLLQQLEDKHDSTQTTLRQLKDNLHLFSRLTNDIHHGVMSLRMIPVKRIFQKFSRVVRDIGRRQKKAIQLLMDGGDIEIDKKVADMLSDPLVHLVRNACDHGFELPDIRRDAGKTEKGTVLIRASQEGGNLYIRIIDDGRGIRRQAIYEKAVSMGTKISSPDDPAVPDLIFMPGLSTCTEISDISGRGVGLDVVRTTVRSLGGSVHAVSSEGKGMEVTLSIPITLGVDTVLFMESGGTAYAIPLEHIVETLKIPPRKIRKAGHQMVFYHRGEVLPAERLETILKDEKDTLRAYHAELPDPCPLVIVRTRRGKYGLIVDELDKNMEVAIKPIPGILAGIDVISGVSVMGDGKVFIVLDPEKLF